jgi:type III secretion protein Q
MPLPFDLPALSRGAAELSADARAIGAAAAAAAARTLSTLLGREVALQGRAVVGVAPVRAPSVRISLELAALPGLAALDVEPALVVRLVDLLAGGSGEIAGATALTPLEHAAAELFALAALDGVCGVPSVEEPLAPRLARGAGAALDTGSALAIELELAAGDVGGRARLLLPASAVRALRGASAPDGPAHGLPVPTSLRAGVSALLPDELEALAPGDVVLFDPPADGVEELVLPGGARLRGRRDGGGFHLEEMTMTERQAQLPITLEVELARVELSVGELARLEPGATLPLALDRRGLVTLRAGERAVARGELVEIDGAVGVRILSLEVGR